MFKRFWRRLVRTGFRLLYNEMAWTYDLVSWLVSLGEWRKWQKAALPFVQGQDVLEIAHGPGHMLLAMAGRGKTVSGLDLSPHMGRLARRRLQRAGLIAALARGQAQMLPFAQHCFDTVYCTFPTLFVADLASIREVYRVLRPGGRYVIVPEGHLTGRGPVQRFIAWLFTITGQRSGPFSPATDDETQAPPAWQPFRSAIEEAGFSFELRQIALERSAVTIIIATREN